MDQDTKTVINLGFEVQFGGEKYQIKKLTIGKSEVWRAKAASLDSERLLKVESAADGAASKELGESLKNNEIVFNANPKYVTDLVIEYCTSQNGSPLTREWLMANATDEEIGAAFQKMLGSVLPFELVTGGKQTMGQIMATKSA